MCRAAAFAINQKRQQLGWRYILPRLIERAHQLTGQLRAGDTLFLGSRRKEAARVFQSANSTARLIGAHALLKGAIFALRKQVEPGRGDTRGVAAGAGKFSEQRAMNLQALGIVLASIEQAVADQKPRRRRLQLDFSEVRA